MTEKTDGGDVRLSGISKTFGSFTAVHPLDLTIPQGSFFALLGASGCGKTTTLRMIAGLEEPTTGTVFLGDKDVTGLPPYKRPVNTVFQSYALFPHLDIFENVAFGLRRRGIKSVKKQVGDMLDLVELGDFARASRTSSPAASSSASPWPARSSTTRRCCSSTSRSAPSTSSCAARCSWSSSASRPRSASPSCTSPHDQEEAMTMADTVAVMNGGRVEQLGAPAELYENPQHHLRRQLPRHLQPHRGRGRLQQRRRGRASRRRGGQAAAARGALCRAAHAPAARCWSASARRRSP